MYSQEHLLLGPMFPFFFLLPLIFNLLATSISHFLPADMKLSGCFSTKFVFFVVYLSLSFAECMNECR